MRSLYAIRGDFSTFSSIFHEEPNIISQICHGIYQKMDFFQISEIYRKNGLKWGVKTQNSENQAILVYTIDLVYTMY